MDFCIYFAFLSLGGVTFGFVLNFFMFSGLQVFQKAIVRQSWLSFKGSGIFLRFKFKELATISA